MPEEHQRAGWSFYCVVALSVSSLLVLSIGPACWLSSRWGGMNIVSQVYRPVTWVAEVSGSDAVMGILQTFSTLGSTNSAWAFSPDDPGKAEWASVWPSLSTVEIPLSVIAPLLEGIAEALEDDAETQEQ